MKVSYNWIKEYLNLDLSPEDLGDIMTSIGLEVEGIDEVESVKGGLKGVVVGEVIDKIKHPNADKLSVTQVKLNPDAEPVQIVCGAPNVRSGLKVLVATIGTTLYAEDGEAWKIKKGKIRGEESHGMICAEDELGLGQSHDGVMELDAEARVGQPAADFLGLTTDFVFDVGLTPNRSDATGHLGVARDIKAYFDYHHPGKIIWSGPMTQSLDKRETTLPIEVAVHDYEACPRYSGVVVTNLKVGPSPKWIQERLQAIGVRPMNNVVDITNFVLHEYGQPLHAFDYDKIAGHKINVRSLEAGTLFLFLDEKERNLDSEDLMICDGDNRPMCLAGIFGGIGSGVSESTKTIFLESAHFHPIQTRRSSTRHLLFTDAAKCFEKGSDPNGTVSALERAHYLLQEYAGGKVASDLVDLYPEPVLPKEISTSRSYINRLLGHEFTHEELQAVFQALKMNFAVSGDDYKVSIPTDKADVTRPADLAEEVLRIYGMNTISVADRLSYSYDLNHPSENLDLRERISTLLSSRGVYEAMGMSLTQGHYWEGSENLVEINNTSNIHLNVMRPHLIASMLESVAYNLNRQVSMVRLFEFGKAYFKTEKGFQERQELGMVLAGSEEESSWRGEAHKSDFFQVKAWVFAVLHDLGVESGALTQVEDPVMKPCYALTKGPMEVYRIGEVNPAWKDKLGIKQDVFAATINWQNVLRMRKKKIEVENVSKFPKTRRDLAVVLNEETRYEDIRRIMNKNGGSILEEVGLFDIYRSAEHLGEDKKSYAFKLIFGHQDRTLKDKEVDQAIGKIISQLERQLGAVIRS